MIKAKTSSRRNFLKGGALLATPIAAASVCAAALADDGLKDRVTRLEDEAAIRELHQSWVRRVNGGEQEGRLDQAVRRIAAHQSGAPDCIAIAADGQTAVGLFDQSVELETSLPQDFTLAQMAHAQGHGTRRHSERWRMRIEYLKTDMTWTIEKIERSNVV